MLISSRLSQILSSGPRYHRHNLTTQYYGKHNFDKSVCKFPHKSRI
nr:MAG TPA: hypothetical protein [Bacteriophage sp.]